MRDGILNRINELASNPVCEKGLKGRLQGGLCRARVGDYRIIYSIDHEHRIIRIIDVGKRENIYERL
ncbi:type II toxin-antitoxin system RelE/ParE family toxin [Vulcanisaeta souniana]|uniref:type II toxin-antitoxin system RelE family toxin n=1 Tax=Vulcanisaeta souniana TaxID=164452 RepID=UPI0006D15E10|nr:type II toxin-antitoxin system RelE/ParE family toxin [Vulcanisaeta souniana]